MRRFAVPLVIVLASAALLAQDYRVEVRLVEVEVRVTDRAGNPVTDLTRGDFTLKEENVAHDVATAQYVPVIAPGPARWERADGTLAEPVAEPPAPVSPTWIYIAAEVAPTDAQRAVNGIREFLLNGLQPGFKVSLGGRAFTDDRAKLLTTLNQLERGPIGADGLPGLVDLVGPLNEDAAEERAMGSTFRRQQEGIAPLPGFTARPEAAEIDGSFARPFITQGRADRQLPVYGDVTLNHYYDLVERLAPLPGKKAVVLMRPGLRLEPDNQGLFVDLASFAVRRRVSFYTVDSRGLDAQPPVEDRQIPFMIDRRRRVGEPDLIGQMEMRSLAREGLDNLAKETGGRSLIGTNRLADVFDKVVEDATGYYVLSYYPIDHRQSGRFRTVKVDVNRPGLKIQQTTRGYYESRPQTMFSKDDGGLALRRAMQTAEAPNDLPVAASVGMFADAEGWPVLVLSAGVPAGRLQPENASSKPHLSATAILRVADTARSRLPIYFERKLEAPLDPGAWSKAKSDRTAFVSMSDMISLLPGEYDWRIVFRDDRTGKMGGIGGRVIMKDFRGPSTASSLLLTRQVMPREGTAPNAPDEDDRPLDAGELRYRPQPSMVFERGETVHLLYSLYNATETDVAAAQRGMQLALLRDGQPVTGIEAAGAPLVDAAKARIDFAGAIRTAQLEPGTYTIIAMLPNFESRSPAHVEQRFLLIDQKSVGP